MTDLFDLPLFHPRPTQAAPEPASAPVELPATRSSAAAAAVRPTAQILPFPMCCDVRLVADLADTFVRLRERYGRRCRSMLIEQRFRPIRARLRRLKVPADIIQQELTCLEAEVARVVRERDGCPELAPRGGGAA